MSTFITIAIFLAAGLFLNRVIDLTFRFIAKKRNSSHLHFFKSMANAVVIVIVIYTLAQQFSVTKDLSTALLQSGSLIVAIATFAAQQALSNVISGISLSATRPYDVDDKIKVVQGGSVVAEGIVKDITLRHTIIRQYNGESCIVPNSVMDLAVITNTNFTNNIGNFMEVTISYGANIHEAMEVMQKICADHEMTLNTMENKVFVKGYAENGVTLKTTIWTNTLDESFQACSDIRISIVEQFRERNIEIPLQTITIKPYMQSE
ncbi:mechanosensitive ion channel family protein [Parablautia intestinalis]|jgi:small-conductance mechanosensitive channel|uniref:mechanosensitive ion channel family protein n=1 Tax=Parablautia intestinalis TaxID=2320100 RepID=UPI0023CC9BAC|nr:mechanosensitive ion channel family protein [Parablautia intestinalis]MCI8615359.1 mechanosensitive ion channel family protein [Lachnospiraceae bacterium]MDE7047572.1 mechanosensitive ion channel family protein [Lachnospiraceae bacterium]